MNAIYQVLDERHHQKTLISRREICYIDPAVLELLVCCSFCFFNNFSRFLFHLVVAFITIARERSFTRAAAELDVSQSALSHTIRNLEAQLGLRLLIRTTRSASPDYLSGKDLPLTPEDLVRHACINTRYSMKEGINPWELKKGDGVQACRVDGPLIFNSVYAALDAALAGYGLAYVPEILARSGLENGRLQAVLEAWCPPRQGFHIFYSSERQLLPALSMIIETLRYEPGFMPSCTKQAAGNP